MTYTMDKVASAYGIAFEKDAASLMWSGANAMGKAKGLATATGDAARTMRGGLSRTLHETAPTVAGGVGKINKPVALTAARTGMLSGALKSIRG